MKKLLLFILLFVQTFTMFGYDYQTVYSHRILCFDNINHETEAIKMDSVRLQQNDSVIYPFKGLQLVGNDCFTPFGFTWMGEKIIVSQNWNYFFTELGDTIKLKTSAKLNETWDIYKINDVTVTGTVTGWTLSNVLGVTDSVKTITLHVFDSLMMPVRHDLEGKTIEISKNYGLVSSVNFLYFPSPQFLNNWNIQISKIFNLVGMTNPTLGVQNFTWFEANDFQVGDEFHYRSVDFSMGQHINLSSYKRKIVERHNFLPDSIVYLIEYTSIDTLQKYISPTEGYTKDIKYHHGFNKEKIVPDAIFDTLPGHFVPVSNGHCQKNTMSGEIKFQERDLLVKNFDCWIIPELTDMFNYTTSVKKGLGIIGYYYGGDYWWQDYTQMDMVYYKKGGVEWGTPIILSGLNNVETKMGIKLSPNPAKDILKITLNESIYEPTTAKIINSLGKTVLVQKLENQEQSVSLKNIPAGIYLLQIEKGNQKESVKFIKQ